MRTTVKTRVAEILAPPTGGLGGATVTSDNDAAWEADLRLAGVIGGGDEGLTAKELAAKFGVAIRTMRQRLYNGVKDGTVRRGRGVRLNKLGDRRLEPVYQLVDKKKGGRKRPKSKPRKTGRQ